jgi:hypothetical protein
MLTVLKRCNYYILYNAMDMKQQSEAAMPLIVVIKE